jgi:hypothetical protein
MKMQTRMLVLLLTGTFLTGSVKAAGVKIGDDQTYLKVAMLLQSWAAFSEDAAPDGESLNKDFYLRRMRILLFGRLNDKIRFFAETDNPNFGKNGNLGGTFIQDAWVEFNLAKELQINVGMLLIPFSHHGMQGAVSLHSLDYHAALIKYPVGSQIVWRDFGVMARGLLLNDKIEYRLAVLNGVHGDLSNSAPEDNDYRNPKDAPRVSGRLTLNLFDHEGGPGTAGFYWDGIYLKKTPDGIISAKKILSFGASFDWQPDLNVTMNAAGDAAEKSEDYYAFAGDVFFDMPLSPDKLLGLSGQINAYYYNHGEASSQTGVGVMSEVGIRYDAYEFVASVDYFDSSKTGDAGDYLGIYGGFNYWWFSHATSIKVQLGGSKINNADEFALTGIVQVQLLF